jgi:hypothetical protein
MCASDNIAVYISLFVGMRLWEIMLTTALYYVLLLVSIVMASLFMQVTINSRQSTLAVVDNYQCVTIETDRHVYTHTCASQQYQFPADIYSSLGTKSEPVHEPNIPLLPSPSFS